MIKRILLLSGTPGTGKTSVAKYLKETYDLSFLSLSTIVQEENLYDKVDEERDTKIVNADKLEKYIDPILQERQGDICIEAHYADMIEKPQVEMGIILRCHPVILENRLKKRDYKQRKVDENIQAELVSSPTSYMLENAQLEKTKEIYEIDTSRKTVEEVGEIIATLFCKGEDKKSLRKKYKKKFSFGKISWLSDKSVPSKFFKF